jgi:hypothetical protein
MTEPAARPLECGDAHLPPGCVVAVAHRSRLHPLDPVAGFLPRMWASWQAVGMRALPDGDIHHVFALHLPQTPHPTVLAFNVPLTVCPQDSRCVGQGFRGVAEKHRSVRPAGSLPHLWPAHLPAPTLQARRWASACVVLRLLTLSLVRRQANLRQPAGWTEGNRKLVFTPRNLRCVGSLSLLLDGRQLPQRT